MKAIVILFSLFAGVASAAPCPRLEYAEMDAMSTDDLLTLRCEYSATMYEIVSKVNTGSVREGIYFLNLSEQCAQEANRMDRLLARKLGIKGGLDDAIREVSLRCAKK